MPRTRKTKAQKLREMRLNSVPFNELSVLDKSYLKRLDEDKRYSLEIDPYNLYEFDDVHKQFIYYYVQHRNVPLAAKLAGINENKGIELFREHAVREEIDRINIAMYARNFSTKMLSLEEIGAYLSAIATDQVPDVDKLSTKDKIPVLNYHFIYLEGDNSRICEKYELPIDYIDLASKYSKITYHSKFLKDNVTIYFNQDEIRSINGCDLSKGIPIACSSKGKFYYYTGVDTISQVIARIIEDDKFIKLYEEAKPGKKYTY